MEQSPFRETNQFSASQEISPLYGTQISLQHSQVPVRILSPYQWINPGLRHQFIFHNMIRFYGEELFAHHQNPKLDCHPLLAVHDSLFNIFKATLHIGVRSFVHNLRTCHAVVSGFHLSWLYCKVWWIYYNNWFRRWIVSMYNKHYCFHSSWYVSFLGTSGKITYQALHLPLQILCFQSLNIVYWVKRYV